MEGSCGFYTLFAYNLLFAMRIEVYSDGNMMTQCQGDKVMSPCTLKTGSSNIEGRQGNNDDQLPFIRHKDQDVSVPYPTDR